MKTLNLIITTMIILLIGININAQDTALLENYLKEFKDRLERLKEARKELEKIYKIIKQYKKLKQKYNELQKKYNELQQKYNKLKKEENIIRNDEIITSTQLEFLKEDKKIKEKNKKLSLKEFLEEIKKIQVDWWYKDTTDKVIYSIYFTNEKGEIYKLEKGNYKVIKKEKEGVYYKIIKISKENLKKLKKVEDIIYYYGILEEIQRNKVEIRENYIYIKFEMEKKEREK